MKYVLTLPAIFSDNIPLAEVIEVMARKAAGGGDGSEPIHRKTLLTTRIQYANSALEAMKNGLLKATDGNRRSVAAECVSDPRLHFVSRRALDDWATTAGYHFELKITANMSIDFGENRGYIWSGDQQAVDSDGDKLTGPQPANKDQCSLQTVASLIKVKGQEWTDAQRSELLKEHTQLKKDKTPSPTRTLAQRYKVSETTIRTQLRKAKPKPATPFGALMGK